MWSNLFFHLLFQQKVRIFNYKYTLVPRRFTAFESMILLVSPSPSYSPNWRVGCLIFCLAVGMSQLFCKLPHSLPMQMHELHELAIHIYREIIHFTLNVRKKKWGLLVLAVHFRRTPDYYQEKASMKKLTEKFSSKILEVLKIW